MIFDFRSCLRSLVNTKRKDNRDHRLGLLTKIIKKGLLKVLQYLCGEIRGSCFYRVFQSYSHLGCILGVTETQRRSRLQNSKGR